MLTGQVGGLPVYGILASNKTFTQSNTTPQNIPGVTFTIGASATEIWWWEAYLIFTAVSATMDIKYAFTVPASAGMSWGALAASSVAGTKGGFQSLATTGTPNVLAGAADNFLSGSLTGSVAFGQGYGGFVYGGGTGGSVQLQASQNTSEANNLICLAGSFIRATKIQA
jgi:hypothetical protein